MSLGLVPVSFVTCSMLLSIVCGSLVTIFRFHGIRPGAVTILESVRVRVRFYLPILFKRFSSSRRRRFFVR